MSDSIPEYVPLVQCLVLKSENCQVFFACVVHTRVTHCPPHRGGNVQAGAESDSRIETEDFQYDCPKGQNY